MRRLWSLLPIVILLGGLMPPLLTRAQQPRRSSDLAGSIERSPVDYEESHALVIGVSDYTGGWRKLPGVLNDVREISGLLERQGFVVEQLLDPTREQFVKRIDQFIAKYGLRERNRLLIYFAGHGHTEESSDDRQLGYIVMRDAPKPETNPEQFFLASVSMEEVDTYARRIRSRHAMFVFDSCFAGTIFRSEPGARKPPRIASFMAQPVRQFITSGTAKQEVPDESIFRQYFMRAFELREGDDNGDGYITGEELGYYLVGRVDSDTRGTQTPRYGKIRDAKLNLGDMVFALPPKSEPPPTPLTTPVTIPILTPLSVVDRCALAWETAGKSDNEETLEIFLRECKDSPQALAADLRLKEIRDRRRAEVNSPPGTPGLNPFIAMPSGVPLSALRSSKFTTGNVDSKGRVTKKETGPIQYYMENVNGVQFEMVAIPGGGFRMGSLDKEIGRDRDETPHWVRVSDFWMGRYEVTQGQWIAIMGSLPANMNRNNLSDAFIGDDLPVVRVSWLEAQEFINRLNELLKLDKGKGYRLPREAEWEYAARGGSQTPFSFGATITPELANYWWDTPYPGGSRKKVVGHPVRVGSFIANLYGLFDIHGNVFEWCEDRYGEYSMTEVDDPYGPATGSTNVVRGGGWVYGAIFCRSADRNGWTPDYRSDYLGFRLARSCR